MTESKGFDFWSIFSSLFKYFGEGSAIGNNALDNATNSAGTNVVSFQNSFLPKIMSLIGADRSPGASEFVAQQSEISRQAAIKCGHPDGVIPSASFAEFQEAEKEVAQQVSDLSNRLRSRNVQLGNENSPNVAYVDSFAKDAKTKEIIDDAVKGGISPTLVDSVKNKLLQEEKALWGEDGIAFMRSSLGRE